jgi:K+-sensing histidine kinase KdpD
MLNTWTEDGAPLGLPPSRAEFPAQPIEQVGAAQWAVRYGASLALVAAATIVGLALEGAMGDRGMTLVFVLPVVISGTAFGLGPSLLAVAAGVLAFDFFFTEPKYSFAIASPTDVAAAALLMVVAAIVSTVAAQSRRRALEARRAAIQAQELHALAHAVVEGRPAVELARAAASALSQILLAPSVIFRDADGRLEVIAKSGGADVYAADEEAARGALASHVPVHAETYPFEKSKFDFWPIATAAGSFVIGVDFTNAPGGRPAAPEQVVEPIGAYLAAGAAAAS